MTTPRQLGIVGVFALVGVTLVSVAPSAPVSDAAMTRDLATLRALLESGADPNAAHGDGMTGLHWAARNGDLEIAALLLSAGSLTEATTRVGAHTALHVAAKVGNADIVAQLLAAGADPNAVTTTGVVPLHFAAGSGSAAAVTHLAVAGGDVDAREPSWGQTPLMFAAANGRVDAITALLAAGADPDVTAKVIDIAARSETDAQESRNRRERLVASQAGQSPLAPQSSERAPSVEARTEPSREQSTEVARAAAARDAAELEANLQEEPEPLGFPELVGTHGGLTALLLAARDGHVDAVLTLLDVGVNVNQVSAADNTSPLLIATINGHFDLSMPLLQRGADNNRTRPIWT